MYQTPTCHGFRWFGGAVFALSLALGGCDEDDTAASQPMRSMQQTPLPRVSDKALGEAPSAKEPIAAPEAAIHAAQAVTHQELPAAKPSQKTSALDAKAEFAVKRLVLTRGIKDKEPLPTEAFTVDGTPVFAFVELSNPALENAKIEIVFEHESGRRVGFVKLDIPAQQRRWRTWGQTRQIRQSGQWVAVVRTGDGQELMRQSFAVGAG